MTVPDVVPGDAHRDGHHSPLDAAARRINPLPYRPQIDSLRAIAAGLVLTAHYIVPADPYGLGGIGVRLFFVISGFLITGILLQCREAMASGASRSFMLRQFYTRRVLRIFPLYYLIIAVAVIFSLSNVRDAFAWYATYTINVRIGIAGEWEGFSHLWTLAVEEQFYLVWPLVILTLPQRRLQPAIILIIAMGPLSRAILLAVGTNPIMPVVMTPSCFDALGLGSLLALCSGAGKEGTEPALTTTALGLGLAILATVTAFDAMGVMPTASLVFFDLSVALVSMWAVARAARGVTGWFGRVLEFPPLVYMGTISYGLYVYHYVLGELTGWSWRADPLRVAGMTALVVTLAAASWQLFERPINALKRKFPYRAPT